MAEKIGYGRNGKALLPLRYVADMFKTQLLNQLQSNMQTQRVFPYEVYPGYIQENEYRRQQAERAAAAGKKGPWYSTGEGIQSFEADVLQADESTGVVTMTLRFAYYMQFVDIGVFSGHKAETINRAKNVNFKQRYISRWFPKGGSTGRPGIQPEWNHLKTRLEGYIQRYYDAKLDFRIMETFEDQPWSFNIDPK